MQNNQIQDREYVDFVIKEGTYKTKLPKRFKRKAWEKPNPNLVKTFIPGTVLNILVRKGEKVNSGQQLAIFVAMKMHNVILSPHDGIVREVLVSEGDVLRKGIAMFEIV
ncbi:MAG: biotin/lipoyl-containing protein [Bacteroidales bacterium]